MSEEGIIEGLQHYLVRTMYLYQCGIGYTKTILKLFFYDIKLIPD